MANPDPAAGRFWLLQFLRLVGVVMAALGAMALAGRLDWPREVGFVLLVAGAFEFFFIPGMLARKWRTPDP